jgi:hypothetical protein
MLSWLARPFHAVRLGLDVQNALAFGFLRLVGSATNTEPVKMIAYKIGVTPNVQGPVVSPGSSPPLAPCRNNPR